MPHSTTSVINTEEYVLQVEQEGKISKIDKPLLSLIGKNESDVLGKNIKDFLELSEKERDLMEQSNLETITLLAETETLRRETEEKTEKIQKSFLSQVLTFIRILESRDPYRRGHSATVAKIALSLAQHAKVIDAINKNSLFYASLLCDLGCILIPDSILQKAARLSPTEFDQVKKHPLSTLKMIEDLENVAGALPIIRHHHENWDGSGYSDGLSGDNIPLGARVLRIADSYVAIVNKRPYHIARSHTETIEIMRKNSGIFYDPALLKDFEELCGALDFIKITA